MDYLKIYNKICRVLIQYTSLNNANMFTISNSPDKGEIGIKKAGQVIVVLGLYGNADKMIPKNVLAEKKQKYSFLKVFAYTDKEIRYINEEHRKMYPGNYEN